LREVARQGLLPYSSFFASTKPFGTPLAPVCLKYLLTAVVIVALPAQDAFNFLVDLSSYPNLVGISLHRRTLCDQRVAGVQCCNCHRIVASSKAANAYWPCTSKVSCEEYLRFPLPPQCCISPHNALVLSLPINAL
jgi:hypothetical protein